MANGCKMYQMAIKYTSIFHRKVLQNLPRFEFLVSKFFHLATLAPARVQLGLLSTNYVGRAAAVPTALSTFSSINDSLDEIYFLTQQDVRLLRIRLVIVASNQKQFSL
jgi:hypothetical protein